MRRLGPDTREDVIEYILLGILVIVLIIAVLGLFGVVDVRLGIWEAR